MDVTYLPSPVSAANELISLGHRAIDEGRPSDAYFDHARRILDAYEANGSARDALLDAAAWLARP